MNTGRIFEEDVFTAVGHCDSADSKIKRPKPAAKIYQNKSHNRSAPSSVCRPLFMSAVTRPVAPLPLAASGPQIPNDVLNDICFRFLINIPEDEKSSIIRICFQIELAHWFYMDFYCKGTNDTSKCPEIGLRDFIRQIFNHCDFLSEYSGRVDQVIEQWREYKSSVPTYGAILLDSTLDFVLLVQGYYARNSWGFPKGKVNESEEPTDCAVREVAEEVGFDISDKIRDKLLIQKFINETLTRLYIITDVPVDFSFAPRTRNEIGKIQWFSIWDLPMDRNDQKTCERIGLVPNNFYTVIPFVSDLQAFVIRQQSKRNKPKLKNTAPLNIGARSASAFDPVLPQQRVELMPSVFNSLFPTARGTSGLSFPSGSVPLLPTRDDSPPSGAFFKPLNATPQTLSFTGPSFMRLVSSGTAANSSCSLRTNIVRTNAVARPVPTMPKLSVPILGVPVYEASKKHISERKSTSMDTPKEDLIPLLPPAPVIESPSTRNKETTAQRRARRLRNKKSERDIDLEEFTLSSELQEITHTPVADFNVKAEEEEHLVQLCEAWKSFKLDVSSLFVEVA